MPGEKNLPKLLQTMQPRLQEGDYVFCTVSTLEQIDPSAVLLFFREEEGLSLILEKKVADRLQLSYSFVAAWITLTVHSSLEAVGLTAAFSSALAKNGISCNVVAAFYHDHLFVAKGDAGKAMEALRKLAEEGGDKTPDR